MSHRLRSYALGVMLLVLALPQAISRADLAQAEARSNEAAAAVEKARSDATTKWQQSERFKQLDKALTDANAAKEAAKSGTPQDRLNAAKAVSTVKKQLADEEAAAVEGDPAVATAVAAASAAADALAQARRDAQPKPKPKPTAPAHVEAQPPQRPIVVEPRLPKDLARFDGSAPAPGALVTRETGESVVTRLTDGIAVNDGSSLHHDWLTVHTPQLPADIIGTVGPQSRYEGDFWGFTFPCPTPIEVKEPVAVIEVRYVLFDFWGDHLITLSDSHVMDIPPGRWVLKAKFVRLPESWVTDYYASIAYISRVRLKDGRVFETDTAPVIDEAKKLSKKFTPQDLEPKPRNTEKASAAAKA